MAVGTNLGDEGFDGDWAHWLHAEEISTLRGSGEFNVDFESVRMGIDEWGDVEEGVFGVLVLLRAADFAQVKCLFRTWYSDIHALWPFLRGTVGGSAVTHNRVAAYDSGGVLHGEPSEFHRP